jgi:hypothetical protein
MARRRKTAVVPPKGNDRRLDEWSEDQDQEQTDQVT